MTSGPDHAGRRPRANVGVLVVTHGRLAEELVASAHEIVGPADHLEALSIAWNDDVEVATGRIRDAVERLDRGSGVVLLTDMFGGTPSNLALSIHEAGRIEVVTGVNLPMLIGFVELGETTDVGEDAVRVASQAREAIQVASQLLRPVSESPRGEEPD